MRRLQRTIEQIGWSKVVPRLVETDRVFRAFELMSREAHDCVLVMRGGALAGIFTSRDFLSRVAVVRGDPHALALGEVMTPRPRTLRPRDGVVFAVNWMAIEGFRNVPIVDERGGVLGVLTIWDVMRHLGELFDEIDAAPRARDDIAAMIDLGGSQ
ncbi:MAG: CBS domain-containing protein [Kofleriaceae bacterium]